MMSKLQASAKLYLLVFVMSVFIIGIGVYGIHELKTMNQNTTTLYADRVFPLHQLTTIRLSYASGILSSSEKVQTSQFTFREALKQIQESVKRISSNWKSYMLTYLTPEEKQLAGQAAELMDQSANTVEKLETVMSKEDRHDLDNIVKNELYPAINPIVAKLTELIDLQVRVSGEILNNSNKVYNNSLKKFILLIVLSLIFAVPFSYYLVKSIKDLIQDLQISNKKITESERKSRALIENAGDAIFMVNKDTFITEVNDYACRLLGYSRGELLLMKISEVIPQEERNKQVLYIESINKNINSLSERRLKRKDGSEVDTEINTRLLKGEGYISIIRDITERKLAEKTLRQSFDEIRRLTEHLQKIREEERIRIAREIHDELGQQLTAVKMDVAWIDKKTSEEMIDIKRKLKNVIQLLDGSNQSVRRILSELRPRVLDDHGLLEAIQWLSRQFAETTGIPIQFATTEKDLKVPEKISTCIFRVCQEAFTNIMRHAHAKTISCSIKVIEGNIMLTIEDDGVGFDVITEHNKKIFGILGMKERVLFLGGKFELVSSPGNGTTIRVSLPYNA